MLMKLRRACKHEQGFTLIELMIVVAIIGILAAIAVPNFIAYRNKSRVASATGTGEGIRAAFANFAADSTGNEYPLTADIGSWDALVSVANANGGTLKTNSLDLSITSVSFNSDGSDYTLTMTVNVPDGVTGQTLQVTPGGIDKL